MKKWLISLMLVVMVVLSGCGSEKGKLLSEEETDYYTDIAVEDSRYYYHIFYNYSATYDNNGEVYTVYEGEIFEGGSSSEDSVGEGKFYVRNDRVDVIYGDKTIIVGQGSGYRIIDRGIYRTNYGNGLYGDWESNR